MKLSLFRLWNDSTCLDAVLKIGLTRHYRPLPILRLPSLQNPHSGIVSASRYYSDKNPPVIYTLVGGLRAGSLEHHDQCHDAVDPLHALFLRQLPTVAETR